MGHCSGSAMGIVLYFMVLPFSESVIAQAAVVVSECREELVYTSVPDFFNEILGIDVLYLYCRKKAYRSFLILLLS